MTTTSGRSTSGEICRTTSTPAAEPTSESGNRRRMSQPFTRPERTNVTKLASAPITAAALFVPSARCGGKPIKSSAGSEIRPPPPTTESMNAAQKPNTTRNASTSGERISKKSSPLRPGKGTAKSIPYSIGEPRGGQAQIAVPLPASAA